MCEVRHQERAMRMLRYASVGGRMPHAFIFHGPEGVGRELCARQVGAAMLCEQGGDRACGSCQACVLLAEGTHPDMHLIHRGLSKQHPVAEVRKRKGLGLGVGVIRHFVIEVAAHRPRMGRGKVFVIREAERMAPGAQNALLKTLEEPPPATTLILVSASLDALLVTVRSRSQAVAFGLLPHDFIVERLVAMNDSISPQEASFCAEHANGSLGVAQRHFEDGLFEYDERVTDLLSKLDQVGPTAAAKQLVEHAKSLGEAYKERDSEISDTEAQRRGLKGLMSLIAMGIRRSLHACVGAGGDPRGYYATLGERASPREATDAVRGIIASERQLDRNVNVQLCVEGMLIRLSRAVRAS